MSQLDLAFLRLCPVVITMRRGKNTSASDATLIARARPLWLAGYVTEKATVNNLNDPVLTIWLTDAGRTELSRPA